MHTHTDLTQALQRTLHTEIPITRHIGLLVVSYDGSRLALSAPIERNINHKATAFAGSLNSVATLAGWGLIWILLQEAGIEATIVIQDSSSHYRRPITHDFTASCQKPDEAQVAQFTRMLREKGRARLELQAEIHENDAVAMSFHGRYVAQLHAPS
ncbi:MAG TPA: thioesterase domain-containing protein [Ktedonobacteraceae bacterium]|nr:thioesterase domain-containing protein [Ktedonobacteraceae bacterium]